MIKLFLPAITLSLMCISPAFCMDNQDDRKAVQTKKKGTRCFSKKRKSKAADKKALNLENPRDLNTFNHNGGATEAQLCYDRAIAAYHAKQYDEGEQLMKKAAVLGSEEAAGIVRTMVL